MAKKYKMPDMAVMKMRFRLNNIDPDTGGFTPQKTLFVDLSQCASIVNRRFYRQGLVWPVQGFELKDIGTNQITGANVLISKLQDTWPTNNAWTKSRAIWDEQQMRAVEDMGAESAVARFRDYKIHMDSVQVAKGYANNALPISADDTAFIAGEWMPSQVVVPTDGGGGGQVEYYLQMYDDSTGDAKSILGGYVFSRAFPQSPDPQAPDVNTSWYNLVMDYGNVNDDIMTNVVDTNDDLPYSQTEYPGLPSNGSGAEYHDKMLLTSTTISATDHAPGGVFQCGLIRLDLDGFSDGVLQEMDLIINLIPGNERGYATVKMEDF